MSDRVLPNVVPTDLASAVTALVRRVTELEAEVRALQAAQGRMLSGDYRFEVSGSGAVVVRRVSTGNAQAVTSPL